MLQETKLGRDNDSPPRRRYGFLRHRISRKTRHQCDRLVTCVLQGIANAAISSSVHPLEMQAITITTDRHYKITSPTIRMFGADILLSNQLGWGPRDSPCDILCGNLHDFHSFWECRWTMAPPNYDRVLTRLWPNCPGFHAEKESRPMRPCQIDHIK